MLRDIVSNLPAIGKTPDEQSSLWWPKHTRLVGKQDSSHPRLVWCLLASGLLTALEWGLPRCVRQRDAHMHRHRERFDVSLDCTVITALMYRHLKRSQTHQKREPHARTHKCCVFCFRLTQHGSSLSLPESPLPDSLFTSSWLTIRLVHACVCVCVSRVCVCSSAAVLGPESAHCADIWQAAYMLW